MNRIARDIMRIATELLPRIIVTFKKSKDVDERELNNVHVDIQRFVSTLRKNEQIEAFVTRMDNDAVMSITVGFSDHEAMKGIVESMTEMMHKIGKKTGLKVKVEFPEKSEEKI